MSMKNVEDIYPLSPTQEGILFHTRHDPVFASYFEIITWVMRGEVDVQAFGRAWQRVVERHPVLRTAFVWEGLDEPLQVVRRRAKLPFAHHDWRASEAARQEEMLEQFYAAERQRGFDLSKAPLMRVSLIQTGEDAYRVVWSYYHGLVDGWSGSLILGDVFTFYEGLSRGVELELPPPRPFRHYIDWVKRQDLSEARDYWRRTLKGFSAATPIGVGGGTPRRGEPSAPAETRSYREQQFNLPAETTAELVRLSRQHQLTLNTICQGAWALLLSRYSGERDVVFGVAVSGRPPTLEEVESIIGMFINTLPARVEVPGGRTLIPWLKEIQSAQAEMRRYEYSPLVEVQGLSEVPRSTPLFESIVSFENHPIDYSLLKRSDKVELRDVVHYHTATGYPLNLIIEPGVELVFKILYDFGRFDDEAVARILGHLRRLLTAVAADPHLPLSEFPLLTEAEERQLLVEWNSVPRVEPAEESIHGMFEAQAERTPERVALVAGEERITYAELNRRANRLARHLRRSGVGPEVPVALCAERSVEMVVALLGVLKAGAAYVPLDPSYPPARLAFMLDDSQAPVLLTQQRLAESLLAAEVERAKVIRLDADREAFEQEEETNPARVPGAAQHLAYFIYTSGSTGRPKGVAITHRSAAVFLQWAQGTFDEEQLAGVLASTSISFDLSVFELFAPLSVGGTVILAENALHLPTLPAAHEVTLVNTVPSAMAELVRAKAVPPGVRTVNLAGEPLPRRLVEELYGHESVRRVFNLYGPSEDTTYSTYALVGRDETGAPSIGRPVSNTRVYILDGGLRPVPAGVVGELFIGGEGLARGYHRQPGLTAERFIPDPFGGEPGARLYRTGDLARYLPDGNIEFLGRADQQVKIRGFRIEMGEVELAVEAQPGVRECVVLAREDAPGEKRLVAYVVPQKRPESPLPPKVSGPERDELLSGRQHSKLPNGMVVAGHGSLQTSGVYREIFEDKIYLKHGIRLEDGDCVFDVGANVGLFSLFVKQQARGARVYAFEPLPPNFDALRTNVELYGLDVNLFECGMSKRRETATFTFYPHAAAMSGRVSGVEEDKVATRANVQSWLQSFDGGGGAGAAPQYGLDEFVETYLRSESYDCQLTTLSEVIREHRIERIDLLKLDVEKSEFDVLSGIEEGDWKKIRQLVIEVHTEELLARISDLLRERGFTFAVDKSTLVEEAGQDVVRVYMLYARAAAEGEAASNGGGREARAGAAEAERELSLEELRRSLRATLPAYMIPSAFVVLDELPLTPNGKVDRRALPAPEQAESAEDGGHVAPRTPVEEIVAGICAGVLGLERVDVTGNFFELGGHSLLAAQVISRVRETFKVELSLRNLFLKPTVEGLAENIERSLGAGEGLSVGRIEKAPRRDKLPLSFSQQRLWFLDQMEPGAAFYNITSTVRLQGELNLEALREAFAEIVRRHEALRTTFAAVDGRPVQVINPQMPLALEVEEVGGESFEERVAAARLLAHEEAGRPFDLQRGPLLRVRLLRLSEGEHLALLTMHHIISDGWSIGVLVNEVSALYEAFSRGARSPLAELPIQYADYAVWQREWLQGEALEAQLSYWREQLKDAPPLLELPTDRPRPAVQSYRGGVEHWELDEALTQKLRTLSRAEGATLFMTLLAAFKVLLHRYSGQADIIIGSDIANRNRAETEGLIGFFVNMMLLRSDLSDNPAFAELLGRVREAALSAYAHQDVPFEKLVEELQPERSLSHSPLFNVVFVLQNVPMGSLELPGLRFTTQEFESNFTRFDLEFHLWEREGGLSGFLIYNTDLFEAATVRRLLGHFKTLLVGIVAEPDRRVASLPLLAGGERRELLVGRNDTAVPYPKDDSVHGQFELQAARSPRATAVVFGDESLTYEELNRRSNQLARRLRSLGVGPEVPVALCVERSTEMIVALLGILKAGGYYVPLDPANPLKRHSFMLEQTGAPVILSQESLVDELPAHWGHVLLLDSEWESVAGESGENLDDPASGDNLIYVMYTSGSTGLPKGVSVTHRGVMRLVKESGFARMDAGETFLQLAPLSFDASTFEIWGALLNGAKLVVMPPESPTLGELGAALKQYGVTTLWLTAGLFHLMVDEHVEALEPLRQLLAGGDVLSASRVREAAARLEGCQLINGYGPTESTTFACCYPVPREGFEGARTPIGRPISNTRVYLLDSQMEPSPVGVAGELYIGGEGLARGYLNRPDLTAERFVPDPFSAEPGARLYRTGDLARYLADGEIEFLGRLDHQVKLRGFRIELGEVEAALSAHHLVGEATVLMREDTPGEKRIVAYVAGEGVAELTAGEWQRYLREQLPEYMIPSAVVALGEMPLTPNGKIDRAALPPPEQAGGDGAEGFVAPRTPTEDALAGIWREVLGAERVGAEDNFFDLGGHSLLATQVMSRIREAFRVELPLRDLFELPTVAGLAGSIDATLEARQRPVAPPIVPVTDKRELPLSFAQQRLWFLNQLEPDSPFYNIPFAVRLKGALVLDALEETLAEIVRRHEVLRTTFSSVEGRPVQVVGAAQALKLTVEDLSQSADPALEAKRIAREEAERPFHLQRGPLLRVRLLRLSEGEHLALLTMHHIISDGWSIGVLVNEVSALYAAFVTGQESPLEELPVQYADYAVWQREWLRGEALEAQLSYWREQLKDAPPLLELPTDRPRPAVQSYRGGVEHWEAKAELAEGLRALSRAEGATLFMTLLAAFKVLLHRYSGQADISVGSPIANRNRAETEGLIGFFVNTLVLRAEVRGDEDFAGLLGRVRETTLGAYEHQDVPFERLVGELQPERDMSRSPLFQVMFALQNAPQKELALPGLRLEMVEAEATTEKFDLTLTMAETEGGLRATWTYNSHLFDAATVRRLAGHFERLLESVAGNPSERVGRLPLMGDEEQTRLLFGWNATAKEFPRELCLHELFEGQAEKTPEALAIVSEGERLTYAQLNARANQLAHHLRGLGVGADTLVGIFMEHSAEMVVSLLAVLKAGGAYVPLDTSAPPERLSFMLKDAGVRVLLTQGRLSGRVPAHDGATVYVDDERESLAARATANPSRLAAAENVAYVIYTSGSTGRPKGVAISHRSICNHMLWMQEAFPLGPEDRVLQKTVYTFDASVWEFYAPLLAGAQLVVARPGGHADSTYLVRAVIEHSVTVLQLVPSVLRVLLEEPEVTRCVSLRRMFCGGEALPREVVERFHSLLPAELINLYGPTEATVEATYHVCVRGEEGRVPIGRPVWNAQVYVLDAEMRPVPLGVRGELYIGGECVGRGYRNNAALTAERFVPDPFGAGVGGRLYRTGDLVRYRADGQLEFVARADDQLKLRGLRIEPSEIEAALAETEGVRKAVVLVREDKRGEKRLVAYVVQGPCAEAGAGELRERLRERLPEYMVPTDFVTLDEMPLLPNGKVDRRALPEPAERAARSGAHTPPRTAAEEVVAGIWAEVLGVGAVGAEDNFFELGGHSLLATQVVSRVRRAFSVELPLRALFEAPTVEGLTRRVVEAAGVGAAPSWQMSRGARESSSPLSFAQQRMWFLHQLEDTGAAYHIPFVLRVSGALDVEALEYALGEVTRRHEVLRTTFDLVGGEPVQVVGEPRPLKIRVEDLSRLPETEREAEAARLTAEEAGRRFDLQSDPPMRASLIRLGEGDAVLVFVMHHIASDAWSTNVLLREVVALYTARVEGGEPAAVLPELSVQYADFSRWQREWLRGSVYEEQISYWRKQLGGPLPALELPADRPRPPAQSFRGAQMPFDVPAGLAGRLKSLSKGEGVTLFMTLLGAFQSLLQRYTGQEELIVGTPIANRNHFEIENLIGFFVNTLALRTDFSGDPTFRELLGRVRETALGAYAHQDIPFEKLVEELQPERDLSRNPIFQVLFVLQNAPAGALELPGVTFSPRGFDIGSTRFDLECHFVEDAEVLHGLLIYSTDLFDEATARRMVEHFGLLLESVAADPDAPLRSARLMTEAEERRLLFGWNDTAAPLPRGESVHELFARQVERTPEETAVEFGAERLSYRELNSRADALARRLRRAGAAHGSVVGICVERSLEMVVGVLAVLKAGGAYLPLDPEYPAERLRLMLDDAGARVLVAGGELPEGLARTPATVLRLDVEAGAEAEAGEDIPPGETTREDLAYVLYTSGSTGRPKGVAMRHGALLNLLGWQIGRSVPAPRTLQFASLSFDVSFQEIFSTLCAGGTLVLIEEATRRDPEALLEVLARGRVERLFLPFVALQSLAEAADRGAVLPGALREVVTAGEQLKITPQLSRLFERLGGCVLENQYGPTEAHAVSAYRLEGDAAGWPELPPIGRPIANTRLYVLDARLQPVPPGVVGELYISGAGLARGYLGRAEATAEKFIPDPFSAEPGARLYRTGDLARFLAGGDLQFLGRRDRQVKVRGYRVEIGEIETALAGHAEVREAVVEALSGATGTGRLAAYVVAAGGARPTPAQLRAYLKERLPEYMIPSAFVFLEEFPLTPSGKVDRRALPEPSGALAWAAEAYVPPRTSTEEVLEAIWADVLGLERVSANANFFELGGHSLMATQVVSRIREAFRMELPLRRLFEEPTVAGLARAVEEEQRAGRGQELPPLTREPHEGAVPLSFAQQRLWFWEQLQPGTPTYVLTTALRLRGALDVQALGRTLNEVVRRHDILRATFKEAGGKPVQLIAPTAEARLAFVDLMRLPESEREREAKRFAQEDALRPFNLARGPLLRASLLRLGAEEHVAVLSMHHIISDGWSMGVLVKEVATLYEAFVEGSPSPLAELPVQYPDFVRWQGRLLGGGELERQLGYWKRQLGGAPMVLELPTDHPRPAVYASQGASLEVRLPHGLSGELKRLSHREGVTLYMTLLAAFDVLLQRYTSQDEIVVGADMANRTRIETEGLIGFFVNMLVLRTDLSGDPTFTELLGRVRETTLGAYAHQDVPFGKLVEELHVQRDLSRNPLFQVVFVLQNAPLRPLALRGLSLEQFGFEVKTSPFDLVLALSETEEGLGGTLTYSTALFRRETVERMMNHYRMILEGVAADPDRRLSDVRIMRDAEVGPLDADDSQKVKLSRKDLENLILEVSQASQTE